MNLLKRRHFKYDIIIWAVRWYCKYGISYRDMEEMLNEIKIKQDIDEIIKEYNVTDSAKIERVAQRYKEGFIVSFKKGREEGIEISEARGKAIHEIAEFTDLSQEQIEKLK